MPLPHGKGHGGSHQILEIRVEIHGESNQTHINVSLKIIWASTQYLIHDSKQSSIMKTLSGETEDIKLLVQILVLISQL